MKRSIVLITVLLLAALSRPVSALSQSTDSVLDHSEQTDTASHNGPSEPMDTTLRKTDFTHHPDIDRWKKSREFSYMRFLDSFLRKQKDLRIDTVSVDEKSGKIRRTYRSSSASSSVNNWLNSRPLKLFFWLLAIAFIGLISYRVFFKNGVFRRQKQVLAAENAQSLNELGETSEYDRLIAEAERQQHLNLAIRYLFLKTLKNLSEKSLIYFGVEKTNREYLGEMERHNNYDDFRELTLNYEYVWYGRFSVDVVKYLELKEKFENFNSKL